MPEWVPEWWFHLINRARRQNHWATCDVWLYNSYCNIDCSKPPANYWDKRFYWRTPVNNR